MIKEIKKYKIILIVIVQIICIQMLFHYISVKGSTVRVSFKYLTGIFCIIMVYIFFYIARVFCKLKKYIRYKIFSILNILYIINIIANFIIKSILNIETKYMLIPTLIIEVFLIGNIILILTYNRNVRALENKAK